MCPCPRDQLTCCRSNTHLSPSITDTRRTKHWNQSPSRFCFLHGTNAATAQSGLLVANAGPLALVEDGDIIAIDVLSQSIDVRVSQEEMKSRSDSWTPPSLPLTQVRALDLCVFPQPASCECACQRLVPRGVERDMLWSDRAAPC